MTVGIAIVLLVEVSKRQRVVCGFERLDPFVGTEILSDCVLGVARSGQRPPAPAPSGG